MFDNVRGTLRNFEKVRESLRKLEKVREGREGRGSSIKIEKVRAPFSRFFL